MTLLADPPAGLPSAIDPTALSLNENPYPPLPAVRSALIAALDAANRYPEFLPEQLHPDRLEQACAASGQPLELRRHAGYDHGYYFISSFIEDHLRFHAESLQG